MINNTPSQEADMDLLLCDANRMIAGAGANHECRFDMILVSFIGNAYNPSYTWDKIGLSSMASVQIRDAIATVYSITLSPDCFDIYQTPDALKQFVNEYQGAAAATSEQTR